MSQTKRNFTAAVGTNGEVTLIYDDQLVPLIERLGAEVTRASHVEPCPSGWQADMSPIEPGVVLGPYKLRSEALDAEQAWLKSKLFS